ncbi:hypothetical protein FWH58_01045 [Candidatus Saccharibacteria bacterium]|nr:hypothetical protein [Candidatus Saccharibacteria bacterium]
MTSIVGKIATDYDQERLARAVQRAAMANRTPIGDAKTEASQVIGRLERWLRDKTEITSHELRLQTATLLSDYDADAADYYLTENMLF